MRKTTLLLASMALALLVVSGVVGAETFSVTNNKDSGSGSLRAAITSANAQPGRDVITFPPSVRGAIDLKSELPTLQGELEIRGPGATELTVRRAVAYRFRIFTIAKGSDVAISGLTISNGNPEAPGYYSYGGGIYNRADGELTLRGVVVSANRDDYGGVFNEGRLTVRDSTVSGNSGAGIHHEAGRLIVQNSTFSENGSNGISNDGADAEASVVDSIVSENGNGGISNYGGTLTVVGSTVSDHLDPYGGVGISNLYGGTLTVRDSTISGNRTSGIFNYAQRDATRLTVVGSTISGNRIGSYSQGGGLNNSGGIALVQNSTFYGNTAPNGGAVANSRRGKLTLANSTVYGNSAIGKGGGIYIDDSNAASFVLRATIVANNEAPQGPDAFGAFSSGGYNLIGDTSGASGFGPTDLTNTRSGLDPRGPRDNGGPTKTIALVSGSPAIDAVPRTVCPPPATDQRGISRPQDGDGDGTARCDVGAYERRAP